jgi:RNA polymerase sigma-70 factor, ECF subfamily
LGTHRGAPVLWLDCSDLERMRAAENRSGLPVNHQHDVGDEPALVADAQNGSREAFVKLVRTHQARIRTFVGGHLRTLNVVDDVAQETFISAFRSLSSYKGQSTFRVWLLGIARHRILDHLRREAQGSERKAALRMLAFRELEFLEQDRVPVEQRDRELDALEECLQRLTIGRANAVTLHYFGRLPLAKIALDQGKNVGTLRVELLRTRRALRKCIEDRLSSGVGE